jgi:glyceraldehyde 3-phosphate dehydrogenase
MRIGINGFGRIGKNLVRILMTDKAAADNISLAVINIGPADIQAVVYSFIYDSLMGTYRYPVRIEQSKLYITDAFGKTHEIIILAERDPAALAWGNYDIAWVVDASGKFTTRELAQKHLDAGAQSVLITAPAQGEDITIIPGINLDAFNQDIDRIVSLGSCTTNALAPLLLILEKNYGIERAYMTTVHAYTNSQVLLDVDASIKDLRKNRAAGLNIIPTTTGAMAVMGRIFPALVGKITGNSLRVPVATVSLIDLTFILGKNVTRHDLLAIIEQAAESYLKNILAISYEPLVSSDYQQNSYSIIVDALMTEVNGATGKLYGWYDNEWGYSTRLKDFLIFVALLHNK